jgi:hypothetical protein
VIAAVACTAAVLILAGWVAYGVSILPGHARLSCLGRTVAARIIRALLIAAIAILGIRAVRTAVLRARWAWRCRGKPPVPDDGEDLTREEIRVLGNLAAGRDVRSRT